MRNNQELPVKSILDSINTGIIIADSDCRLIFINNDAEEILERIAEDIIPNAGVSIFEIFKIDPDAFPTLYSGQTIKKTYNI